MSDAPELLTYAQVRLQFGWRSNTPIKDALKAGRLTRIFLSKSVKSARITADSVAKFIGGVIEEKATVQQFNVPAGQWANWKAAKAHETEAAEQAKAAVDQSRVAKNIYVNEFGDQFAPSPEGSTDPISGQYTPPGCYRDETDTLVYGLPSPKESQRIFVARCAMRGIRPSATRYTACLMDGAGRYRVNDVPVERQSVAVVTPRNGRIGGEQVVPPKGFLKTHQTRVSGGVR
ncbi:MAG: hypothetical protein WBQ13_14865 [Terriglobales bacterium]